MTQIGKPVGRALPNLSQAAVPYLIRLLQAKAWEAPPEEDWIDLRQVIADALGQMGPAAKAAVPALIELLNDNGKYIGQYVRSSAAKALGRIGDPTAIPSLMEGLREREENGFLSALATMGPPAIPALVQTHYV